MAGLLDYLDSAFERTLVPEEYDEIVQILYKILYGAVRLQADRIVLQRRFVPRAAKSRTYTGTRSGFREASFQGASRNRRCNNSNQRQRYRS